MGVVFNAYKQATDLEITARLILHTKEVLNTYLAEFCEQPIDKLRLDTDRDFYMTPDEALAYGIIDEVVTTKFVPKKPPMPDLKVPPPPAVYDQSVVGDSVKREQQKKTYGNSPYGNKMRRFT